MGEAIGQVLPLGAGVALSPVPLIAVVLMLGTPRARATGPAFLVGWVAGLTLVGFAVLLLAGSADVREDGAAGQGLSWVKLVLGLLLLFLAVRSWRDRPSDDGAEPALPAWMSALDTFTASKALGMGALLSGVNPKNLLLTVGAATAVAHTGIPTSQQLVALGCFVVVGSLGVATPLVVYLWGGSRAADVLTGWKDWMARHNAAIMTVVLLVLGAKLLGDAIPGLAG